MIRIAQAFTLPSFAQLKVLDFGNALLRDHALILADGLCRSKIRLAKLFLQNNALENEGAKAFAEYFKQVDMIEEIDLSQNQIMGDGISEVTIAL